MAPPSAADRSPESVWDYPRPPRIEANTLPLRVEHDGAVLAETSAGYRVLETSHPPTYYLPPDAVDWERLVPSRTRTLCEWKGQARYWSLKTPHGLVTDVCWAYPHPRDERLKDHVSFYAGKVDACFVDDEQVQAQEGSFYGGWINSWITGPFKGGPGTRGW
ncbi:MAG: DUF427 domain-containing protein [Gemmatimonadales bacterium]|nr:MAG: DUF427 domain-containing protein [Gemmatimonadales bacterium]